MRPQHETVAASEGGTQAAFEHHWRLRDGTLPQEESARLQATIGLIQADVRDALDVGCGDGRSLRQLPPHVRGFGVDYALAGLSHVGTHRGICASSASLPFADKSFDLVMCTEVLEHLPPRVLEDTTGELMRVARHFVLVSVPYKERLRTGHTKCPRCQTVFHVWGHVRRFTSRTLDRLFSPHWRPIRQRYAGKRPPYMSSFIAFLNQRLGNRWTDFDQTTMCPNCGNTTFARTPRNTYTRVFGTINRLTSLLPVPEKAWMIKLYARVPDPRRRG